MLELLQAQTVNASDISLGLFEIGAIIFQVITLCGLYFALKYSIKENKTKIDALDKEHNGDMIDIKEKLIDAVTKKAAMRAELSLEIEKKDNITHKRIDAVRDDLKDYQQRSDSEFKVLTSNLAEIKGMLTQILNK